MSGIMRPRRDDREPVVITGLAAVSPLGASIETIFDRLFAGASGVREIEVDPRARTDARFAAPVAEIPVPAGIEPDEFAGLDEEVVDGGDGNVDTGRAGGDGGGSDGGGGRDDGGVGGGAIT
jgi:hypothetical protein